MLLAAHVLILNMLRSECVLLFYTVFYIERALSVLLRCVRVYLLRVKSMLSLDLFDPGGGAACTLRVQPPLGAHITKISEKACQIAAIGAGVDQMKKYVMMLGMMGLVGCASVVPPAGIYTPAEQEVMRSREEGEWLASWKAREEWKLAGGSKSGKPMPKLESKAIAQWKRYADYEVWAAKRRLPGGGGNAIAESIDQLTLATWAGR